MMRSQLNSSARARPLSLIRARSAGSPSSRAVAAAIAFGSRGGTSTAWTPRRTTPLYPWMSLATIGAPAAIASRSTMPNDSPPVAGVTKTSAVRKSWAFSWSLTLPRNSTPCTRRVRT